MIEFEGELLELWNMIEPWYDGPDLKPDAPIEVVEAKEEFYRRLSFIMEGVM